MAHVHVLMGADTIRARPAVRTIGMTDLKDAHERGIADFSAMPTHAVFLCVIYPIVGLVLARLILGYDLLPLLFPLAAGFALVGPFAAIGFYELSRRLPLFLGLAVVVPVLGHSTWHLYRKVVEPDLNPRQELPRPPKRKRYAAQFPAALFAGEDWRALNDHGDRANRDR
jgi:uncharacterized membrane protein